MTREEIAAAEERMTRNLMPTRRQVELLCAQARAYLDLVERIEALATHWEQATLARRQGYPAERARELRALLSQKEPTE